MLLEAFPNLHLYMIDPYIEDPQYPGQESNKRMADTATAGNVRAHKLYMDSFHASLSELVAPELDFVFIDGDHSYSAVMDDLNCWWPRLRMGGLFCGHDYGKDDIPGVTQAVNEWFEAMGIEFSVADGNIWWCKKTLP
jgi:hypothetical protein